MLISRDLSENRSCFVKSFYSISKTNFLPLPLLRLQSHKTTQRAENLHARPPAGLKGEPGGVSSVSAQGAERPHDEFEAGVVNIPQVDVFMGDLHGALPVDVQVRGGH